MSICLLNRTPDPSLKRIANGKTQKSDPKLGPDQQDKRRVVSIELADVHQRLSGTVEQTTELVRLWPVEVFAEGACRVIHLLVATVLLVCASLAPLQASAWGAEGHRIVAEVAEGELTPTARAEVDRLLALEPGASLSSISAWADETRSHATARWHYVNLRRGDGCQYDAQQSCRGGACVVAAIERQVAVLASKAPDEERLKALKYVVHFVADVHQPLHAGYADDRGANKYQVQAFGRGTNLHAVWDTGMIRAWPGGSAALRKAVEAEDVAVTKRFAPAVWAEESCRIIATHGFYPRNHKLGEAYVERWSPTVVQRLAAAALRLAWELNRSLGGQ
jgi:nuclease S1